jgi:hypothetical protein
MTGPCQPISGGGPSMIHGQFGLAARHGQPTCLQASPGDGDKGAVMVSHAWRHWIRPCAPQHRRGRSGPPPSLAAPSSPGNAGRGSPSDVGQPAATSDPECASQTHVAPTAIHRMGCSPWGWALTMSRGPTHGQPPGAPVRTELVWPCSRANRAPRRGYGSWRRPGMSTAAWGRNATSSASAS